MTPFRMPEEYARDSGSRRVPPARQLCQGSNREIEKRPSHNECPVCRKRNLAILVRRTGRRVPATGEWETRYTVPAHLERRES